ncbi:hypothetical protein BGY98DRAFT_992554 [Russula aff. rugulosa BPL654]|nr:hypothetical protein BGY98DRAFT_992554 [Russula aff. rugulosa BPL654]
MKFLRYMKMKIKSVVESSYEFDTSRAPDSISRNTVRAQALLANTTFIYRDFNFGGRPQRGRHRIIFHDYFEPIPIQAIALVLTVIECCIGEWSTGTYKETKGRDLLRRIQDNLLKAARPSRSYKGVGKLSQNAVDAAVEDDDPPEDDLDLGL